MIRKIWSKFIYMLGGINANWLLEKSFGKYFCLTIDDHEQILNVLSKGNYIILTRRISSASTYACNVANLFVTGRFGYYSHACMNIDLDENQTIDSVKILEAERNGVQISKFMDVFNCDSVCILKPVMPEGIDWQTIVERGLKMIGTKYDDFFDLDDSSAVSCVEYVLSLLKDIPEYEKKFHGLIAMINFERNLTPDMFLYSGSFETVLEIRRHF